MFGCEETRRYVDAWVDGELDPGAALHVEAHVGRCGGCRDEADVIRSLKRAMGALREKDQAPASLRSKVLAALEAEDQGRHDAERSAQKRKHAAGFMLAGAALAGFVLARGHGSTAPGLEVQNAGFVPPVLEDIAVRHARDLPMEVRGDQPNAVSNFFRNRLDIPVRPVAFRGMHSQLVGARISNVRDRMAAALFYDVGGRRVTVFVFDSALLPRQSYGVVRRHLSGKDVYIGNAHGYTVAFSEHGGVGYAVASDLPPQDAIRIVERVEVQ